QAEEGRLVDQDMVLYVPGWKNGQTLDLLRSYATADLLSEIGQSKSYDRYVQGTATAPIRGLMAGPNSWGEYWLKYMKTMVGNEGLVDDSNRAVTQSVAVLTLFDRLPPLKNITTYTNFARAELLRRGGRPLNLSHTMAAGNLVILAEVD